MTGGWDLGCRAILFDCDGVLVDSKVLGNRAWSRWADEHGLDPAAVLEGVHGRRSTETVALFLPEARRAAGVTAIDAVELDDAPGTPAMPGALALLPTLPDDGWAVVTSAALPLLRARLSAAGLALPAVVVTSEDVSAGKRRRRGTCSQRSGWAYRSLTVS